MNIYRLKSLLYRRFEDKPKSSITWYFASEEMAYEFLVRRYPKVKESGMTGYKPNRMGYAAGDNAYRFIVQPIKHIDQEAMDKLFHPGAFHPGVGDTVESEFCGEVENNPYK